MYFTTQAWTVFAQVLERIQNSKEPKMTKEDEDIMPKG